MNTTVSNAYERFFEILEKICSFDLQKTVMRVTVSDEKNSSSDIVIYDRDLNNILFEYSEAFWDAKHKHSVKSYMFKLLNDMYENLPDRFVKTGENKALMAFQNTIFIFYLNNKNEIVYADMTQMTDDQCALFLCKRWYDYDQDTTKTILEGLLSYPVCGGVNSMSKKCSLVCHGVCKEIKEILSQKYL